MAVGDHGTVTFQTSAPGAGTLGAQPAVVNVGIDGGQTQAASSVGSGASWFGAAGGMTGPDAGLPQFLEELAGPALARARQEQEWKGFVAARAGQSMQEIAEEQPWYTRLFGPTNYEIGAQTFHVQKQVADMEQDILTRMPELRQLSADEFAAELNRVSTESMTGNLYADSIMKRTLMERAGPLADLHTKERVAWQQAEMARAQVGAISSASTAFQQAMRSNAMLGSNHPMQKESAEAMVQLRMNLLSSLQTSQYQTDDSIKQVMFAAIRGMADRGENYAIQALVDEGLLSSLDVDDAQTMLRYMETADNRNRARFVSENPDFMEQIARMHTMVANGIGGAPAAALATAINDRYAAETGSSNPYYDANEVAQFAGSSASNYIRERNRLDERSYQQSLREQTEAAKQEAELRNQQYAVESWQRGSWGNAVDMKNVERGDLERAALSAYQQTLARDPQAAADQLVYNYTTQGGKVSNMISERLRQAVEVAQDEQITDAFLAQYGQWQTLYNSSGMRVEADGSVTKTNSSAGPATALAYYGEDINRRMLQFQRSTQTGMSPQAAYRMSFGEESQQAEFRGLDSEETRRNVDAFRAALDSQSASIYQRVFGQGYRLHPSTSALVSNAAQGVWGSLEDTMRAEDRAEHAIRGARDRGLELGGRWGWINGTRQESIASYLRDNGEMSGVVMNDLIDSKIKESGGRASDNESITINRLQDDNGSPRLHVTIFTADGVESAIITGEEMQAAYRRRVERDTRVQEQRARPEETTPWRERIPGLD